MCFWSTSTSPKIDWTWSLRDCSEPDSGTLPEILSLGGGGREEGISQTVTFFAEYSETTFLTGTKYRDHKKSVLGTLSKLNSLFLFHRHLTDWRQHVQFVGGSAVKVLHLQMLNIKNKWKRGKKDLVSLL